MVMRRALIPAVSAAVAFATAACTSSGTLGALDVSTKTQPASAPSSASAPVTLTPDQAAAKIKPALVVVDSTLGYQQAEAQGTGVVLTPSGEILTNNHVIAGATVIKVTDVGNGRTYTASVVGFDRSHDIAVLQLAGANGLTTATLETGTTAALGDQVVAVGNAGGTGTLTSAAGAVTALDQQITATDQSSGSSEQLTGLIQVDANLQPGDSGGALVDSAGNVIGIDTAASAGYRFRQAANTTHTGYAIPIASATGIADLIAKGQGSATIHLGETAALGISVSDTNDQSGVLVQGILPGSASESLGLSAGDVITSLDGTTVDTATTLTTLMDQRKPGQSVSLGWTDQTGMSHTGTVKLGKGPAG